jgi:hypothetical protein
MNPDPFHICITVLQTLAQLVELLLIPRLDQQLFSLEVLGSIHSALAEQVIALRQLLA